MFSDSKDMKPSKFNPECFSRGQKYKLDLETESKPKGVRLPVLLVRGARPGKTLVATAAIHGDEYEGVRTIFDVFHALDPMHMSGDFLAVPVSNPPAFWNGTRASPLDGANLARVFPGDLNAGASSIIAYHLAQTIIARADFYLDLHSAGILWASPALAGYNANDTRSLDAALIFGTKIIWGHPVIPPGRTVSFATERNIPWLYTEAWGSGRIDPSELQLFVRGVFNLLRHLKILPGRPRRARLQWHLYGDGNTDKGLSAKYEGFCVPCVGLLQKVSRRQELGQVYDLHGKTIQTLRAASHGIVAMIRQFPVVHPGEPLFLITGLRP